MRNIGVSNFDVAQLQQLSALSAAPLAAVQAHSDPFAQNRGVQAFCAQRGVAFQAYSSLGLQWWGRYQANPVLSAPAVVSAAAAHGVSPGQAVLRWALHRGQAVIPKSSSDAHIRANLNLSFALSADELSAIDAMDGRLPDAAAAA